MKLFKTILFLSLFIPLASSAQYKSKLSAQQWTDSVFNSLSDDERLLN